MPRPAHLPEKPTEVVPKAGTYLAQIFQVLNTFGKSQLIPPKKPEKDTNLAGVLGELYLWDAVEDFAKKRTARLWKMLEEENIIKTEGLDAGTHVLAESRIFVVGAQITAPVKRFNVDELAKLLHKSHKVPIPVVKEAVEKAKKETKGQTRLTIIER